MRNMRGIFPGFFTMGNMLCGFLAILYGLDGDLVHAAWLVILAGFFDALDGKIARFSKSASQFGTELDSFADLVSFGIAPAVILYSYKISYLGKWGWILGFVFILCGAFRLARFNLQARLGELDYYMGLPIPVAAITLTGYTLFCHELWGEIRYVELWVAMVVIFSGLMVSGFSYDTFPKFSLNSRENKIKLLYIFVAFVAILVKPRLMIFPLGLIYIVSGIGREVYHLVHIERKDKVAESP